MFQTAERATTNDFEIYKGTQQQLLTSDVVLIAALRKPEAASLAVVQKQDDPVKWLARNLRVELPPNSEIMRVSLTTSKPDEAALLVGAVVDAYMNEVVDAERHRKAGTAERPGSPVHGKRERKCAAAGPSSSNWPSNWEPATPARWP